MMGMEPTPCWEMRCWSPKSQAWICKSPATARSNVRPVNSRLKQAQSGSSRLSQRWNVVVIGPVIQNFRNHTKKEVPLHKTISKNFEAWKNFKGKHSKHSKIAKQCQVTFTSSLIKPSMYTPIPFFFKWTGVKSHSSKDSPSQRICWGSFPRWSHTITQFAVHTLYIPGISCLLRDL